MVETILLITMLFGANVCIAIYLAGWYGLVNQSAREGESMMYHRLAARGRLPKDFFWKWQDDMYWNIRGTERSFNYTGELFQRFGKCFRDVSSLLATLLQQHWRKLTLFTMGIAVTSYCCINGSEMLLGAAGLIGSPNPKDPSKKKEHSMNKLSSKVRDVFKKAKTDGDGIILPLINAIFNVGAVPFNPTGRDTSKKTPGVEVLTLDFSDDKKGCQVEHVQTRLPGSMKLHNLVLNKVCVMFGAGIKFLTLKYYHVNIPKDPVKATHTMYKLAQWIATNDLVPFGSIKRDSKGRTKFYVLERWEAERYTKHTGDFLPYFHKILTDCKEVEKLNVLVVNPANYTGKGEPNELAHLGVDDKNDGCGFIRPSRSSSQFQAIPDGYGYDPDLVNDKFAEPAHDKMPIAKGYLDNNLVETDDEWDVAIGKEYDMVIFRKDQIKCFDSLAESGEWIVGFTWMNGRTIKYPFHWELTQFLELPDEVEEILTDAGKKAVDELYVQCSTREGLIKYVSEKVYNEMMSGYDTTIKMKVLACLCSDVTHEIKWVKRQVDSMMLGDVWKITKANGIFGDGIPLLTNDVKAETDPAYVPFEIANAVGGDNDGDYIVYIVNKAIGKMLYWRFPVVGGPVLRNIPPSLMPALEDKHPEIVQLFVDYMLDDKDHFTRNTVIKNRNTRPLKRAFYTFWKIVEGEEIGSNTNILKRLQSVLGEWKKLTEAVRETAVKAGECPDAAVKRLEKWKIDVLLPNISKAKVCIESAAIALKYDVEGVEKPVVEKWITKMYPMFYAKLNKPTSWSMLADHTEACENDDNMREFDTRVYGNIMRYAVEKHNAWKSNTVSPSRMAESIDLIGIDITMTNTETAMEFLKEIGAAFRSVFEKYGTPKDGSDDAELMASELSLVVKHAERLGATLSLDVLKLACHEYLFHTKGTGASAIHMCGDRIFDVFGKHESTPDNVKVVLPKPKKDGLIFKAFLQGSDIPFDKINKALGTGKIKGNTVKFNRVPALTIMKEHQDRIPTPYESGDTKVSYDFDIVGVTSYKTKRRVEKGVVIPSKPSNRTAIITVQVVEVHNTTK